MSLYEKYELLLNNEVFAATPSFVEIKGRNELRECSSLDQLAIKRILQTGVSLALEEDSFIYYFPIKCKLKVEAILLLLPKENLESDCKLNANYLEKLAELSCKWVGESIENEQLKNESSMTRIEMTRLFSTVTEPLCLVSHDGIVQEINEPFSALVGNKRSLMIGEKVSQILTASSWDTIKKQTRKNEVDIQIVDHQVVATIQPILFTGEIESYFILVQMKRDLKNEQRNRKLYQFAEIKGVSEALQQSINAAKRVSKGDATIMLRGESGTGKELFAQSIHNESDRKDKPFVAINCAAIPENLLESELFGYEKGSFTGADMEKQGRFELAHKGTMFLDEIGDMSLYLQAKLLRVLQEKTIERIGSNKSKDIDVRIITATHQNLEDFVKEGKFREDLYYRLSVIPIHIPPLRDRKEDLPILIEHYMNEFSKDMKRSPKKLSDEVLHCLIEYEWPGNIRELQNVVRHFVELEIGDTVTMHSLPASISSKREEAPQREEVASARPHLRAEKDEIFKLLNRYGWSTEGKKKVASVLGISLATLYRRMKKLKL